MAEAKNKIVKGLEESGDYMKSYVFNVYFKGNFVGRITVEAEGDADARLRASKALKDELEMRDIEE